MAAALEFQNLTKEYRGLFGRKRTLALDNFTLSVEQGEIFGFLGPNGAGKSTAIHLAMGFMRPTSGGGQMLGTPFGHADTRRRTGFLAENVALYHRRTEGLVRFYGALNRMEGRDLRKRAREVLEAVGLEEHVGRNVSKFSRGMLQRVGLAQALVNDPDLLVLDEPTSALDPLARVMVRELLLEMRGRGKTIFLSSHLLSEVELVCDRIAVMHRGRLSRTGRTADLLQSREQIEIVASGMPAGLAGAIMLEGGKTKFFVSKEEQRATIECVWSAGGTIESVNPARRTLEEIFLEATSDCALHAGGKA